jgi:GT2 family glycosyltransferase
MTSAAENRVAVVVPNWNGREMLGECLDSLLAQSHPLTVIVVENGSNDGSLEYLAETYPQVTVIPHSTNLGFAGGVNSGIRLAIADGFEFVGLFNNDAVASEDWLAELVAAADANSAVGMVTAKFLSIDGRHLDSTGDFYSSWGIPFARGRGEAASAKYDDDTVVFSASGGASLYRILMLRQIGLFDEDFFAYFEDVDLSFRAQLAGWSVEYVPRSIAFHRISATSGRVKGFAIQQTIKNLPWVLWKNLPIELFPAVFPRFCVTYASMVFGAVGRGDSRGAVRAVWKSLVLLPKKIRERSKIQRTSVVSAAHIRGLMLWDIPPTAGRLRGLRDRLARRRR